MSRTPPPMFASLLMVSPEASITPVIVSWAPSRALSRVLMPPSDIADYTHRESHNSISHITSSPRAETQSLVICQNSPFLSLLSGFFFLLSFMSLWSLSLFGSPGRASTPDDRYMAALLLLAKHSPHSAKEGRESSSFFSSLAHNYTPRTMLSLFPEEMPA